LLGWNVLFITNAPVFSHAKARLRMSQAILNYYYPSPIVKKLLIKRVYKYALISQIFQHRKIFCTIFTKSNNL